MADISKLVVQNQTYDIKDTIARNNALTAVARIDELVQTPPSTVDGVAELIGIRTAYDGQTYTTAGAAVSAQASGLSARCDSLESKTAQIRSLTEAQIDQYWNS